MAGKVNQSGQGNGNNNNNQQSNNSQQQQQNNNNNSNTSNNSLNNQEVKKYTEDELRALIEVGKTTAREDFLNSIGISDEEELQAIINQHNESSAQNQTDLQKLTEANERLQKQLMAEKELRKMADVKLLALKFGANPETVDDLVVLAKAKVGDKELKEENLAKTLDGLKKTYPFYFLEGEEGSDDSLNQGTHNSLRGEQLNNNGGDNSGGSGKGTKGKSNNGGEQTIAERLVAGRKKKNENKSSYFTRR